MAHATAFISSSDILQDHDRLSVDRVTRSSRQIEIRHVGGDVSDAVRHEADAHALTFVVLTSSRVVELVDLVNLMLINALIEGRAQQRKRRAHLDGAAPAIEFRLQAELDRADFVHVAERGNVVQRDETFDHANAAIGLIDSGESEGREALLDQTHQFLGVHPLVQRMDVDEEAVGLGILNREIGIVRRLLGGEAVELAGGLPALAVSFQSEIALNKLIEAARQILRHGACLQGRGEEAKRGRAGRDAPPTGARLKPRFIDKHSDLFCFVVFEPTFRGLWGRGVPSITEA
ncbi:MAG TPA: hypothetical protein VGL17_14735 [Gemmatimonadaceae bacterium]